MAVAVTHGLVLQPRSRNLPVLESKLHDRRAGGLLYIRPEVALHIAVWLISPNVGTLNWSPCMSRQSQWPQNPAGGGPGSGTLASCDHYPSHGPAPEPPGRASGLPPFAPAFGQIPLEAGTMRPAGTGRQAAPESKRSARGRPIFEARGRGGRAAAAPSLGQPASSCPNTARELAA